MDDCSISVGAYEDHIIDSRGEKFPRNHLIVKFPSMPVQEFSRATRTAASNVVWSRPKQPTMQVELTVFTAQGIITSHHVTPHLKKLRYSVVVNIGENLKKDRTKVVGVTKKAFPLWNRKFVYHQEYMSRTFKLELICHHKHRKDHVVGCSQGHDIFSLQLLQRNEIQLYDDHGTKCGTITMGLRILVIRPQMDITIHHTFNYLQSLGIIRNVISDSQIQQMSPAWTALLSYFGSVMQLATVIAQIHPIARLAVTAVAFAFEAAAQQCERAKRIDGLVEKMAAIYYLIVGAKPLESIKPFAKTLERLLRTTEDCALFVAEYCRNQNFAVDAVQCALWRVDRLIESYERAFTDLRLEFISTAALHTAIQTIRILEEVQDIAGNVHVINVAITLPLHGGGWDSLDRCLPGSRKPILDDIIHWTIFQDPVAPIYILAGDAGCGKTCVAASIATTFRSNGRLGASIFLDRENKEHRDPTKIFLSIARELAAFDDKLNVRISQVISKQPDLVRSCPEQQLQKLIIEPLSKLTIIGPILIVIDGLDIQPDFAPIFSALQNARNIPRNLRILLTTRPGESVAGDFTDVSHYCLRRMTIDEEGLVNDVQNYTHQCLQVLQDIRPSTFADVSLKEVLADFETKSLGVFLWLAVAIRFLTIASDDTVRAFLAEIMTAKQPKNYSESMATLKHAIRMVLTTTSQIKLKSELSVGGAAALGVVGLKSDKTNQVMEKLRTLQCGDDVAGQYLSTILHPGSRWAGKGADGHLCCHGGLQHASLCMAHVCLDFLSTRLASDVCTRTYHEYRDKEVVIDPSRVNEAPEHLRLYLAEAYRYAGDFWMAHSEDAQRSCAIGDKLLGFSKHFSHLFVLDNDVKKMSNMLGRFKKIIHDINPGAFDDCSSPIDRIQERLDRPDYGYGEFKNHPDHWDPLMDLKHGELCCPCPWYRSWRISSRDVCSFSGDVEYGNVVTAEPICLMVTPPVMPLAVEGGRTYRAIKKVELVVDRKFYDDGQSLESTTIRVGVVIARPHDDVLPEWARSSNVPIRDGAADQMKRPWFSPRAGQISSTIVRWQDERLHYEANHQSRCPLRPGDRLVIAARADELQRSGAVQQFFITLNLEYDSNIF